MEPNSTYKSIIFQENNLTEEQLKGLFWNLFNSNIINVCSSIYMYHGKCSSEIQWKCMHMLFMKFAWVSKWKVWMKFYISKYIPSDDHMKESYRLKSKVFQLVELKLRRRECCLCCLMHYLNGHTFVEND